MGIVYLINIERTDLYKIGITRVSPQKRLKSLQTGNPNKLVLVDYFETEIYTKIEAVMHRILKHKKYIPEDFENLMGEWFCLTFEDVRGFKQMCKNIERGMLAINADYGDC
jgi:hypothetical protein